jgi:hypothetical protein
MPQPRQRGSSPARPSAARRLGQQLLLGGHRRPRPGARRPSARRGGGAGPRSRSPSSCRYTRSRNSRSSSGSPERSHRPPAGCASRIARSRSRSAGPGATGRRPARAPAAGRPPRAGRRGATGRPGSQPLVPGAVGPPLALHEQPGGQGRQLAVPARPAGRGGRRSRARARLPARPSCARASRVASRQCSASEAPGPPAQDASSAATRRDRAAALTVAPPRPAPGRPPRPCLPSPRASPASSPHRRGRRRAGASLSSASTLASISLPRSSGEDLQHVRQPARGGHVEARRPAPRGRAAPARA